LKRINFKTFYPLLPFFKFLGSTSPKQSLYRREEEEGWHTDFYEHFQGRVMPSPLLKMGLIFKGG
jgi:hypothetical protein